MSLTQQPPASIPLQKKTAPRLFGLFAVGREEAGYLGRWLRVWPLYALLLVFSTLFTLAYQFPQAYEFKLGAAFPADHLYIESFNKPEVNQALTFRWSSNESYVRFYGLGRVPYARLELTMAVGGRPAALGPAPVQVWRGEQLLGEVKVGPGDNSYTFEYRAESEKLNGDLIFTLRTPDAFRDGAHDLPLGVVVSKVRLEAGPADGRPVIPALPHLANLLALLAVIYLLLIRTGWTTTGAGIITGIVGLGAAYALAFQRMQLLPPLEVIFLLALLSYPLLVIGLRVTALWLPGGIPRTQARWLGLVFVAAFIVKVAGMNHPAFIPVDHWFRIHQVLRLWNNPSDFWQQYFNVTAGQSITGTGTGSAVLGQWGLNFTLPYSPLFYLLAAPLALIYTGHNTNLFVSVNCLAGWLEASQVFLLYIIFRKAYTGEMAGRAGLFGAGLLGFYPLSFLLFSDGGYNSILAHWLTLLFVALLLGAVSEKQKSRRSQILAGVALAGALLAHTSTLLLLGLFCLVLLGLWLACPPTRYAARRFVVVGAVGFGLALLLYYGYYALSFISDSLPALLNRLGSSGSIGQDDSKLGGKLLSGFWPQLWEHFRLLPFLLLLLAFFLLWPSGKKGEKNIEENPPVPFLLSYTLWVAWLAVFLVFALLDLKVNLLQKHMLFAAPLLCLGSGLALSLLWERFAITRATRIVLGTIYSLFFIFLVWQGLSVWYERVYYYILPPGAG
jgi:hypothetical protein